MNPEVPELNWHNLPLYSSIAQLHKHILYELKENGRIIAPQNKQNLRHDYVDDEWMDWLEDEVSKIWKQEHRPRCGGGCFPWTRYQVFNATIRYFKSKGGRKNPWKTGAYSAAHVSLQKQQYSCQNSRCDKSCQEIHVDHWHAKSNGGPDDIENYRLLCKKCNEKKSDKSTNSWVNYSNQASDQLRLSVV